MLEGVLEKKSKARARRDGWYARKYTSPQHRSSPDDIFAKNGRVFFVEFKRTGESPTELQAEEHRVMRAAGLAVYVCDSYSGEEKHAKHLAFTEILAMEEVRAVPVKIETSWDD